MNSLSSHSSRKQLTVVVLAYLFFAAIFGYAYRFAMNPDGISQLRMAGYIAAGDFQRSVVSGLSPLFIWLTSPFIALGLDGLTAARVTIALCGIGLVLGIWKLALRFDLSPESRFRASLIGSLLTAFWTIQYISPDVLFAAMTLCYLYLVTCPDMLDSKKASFYCGIVGGFSYLAHHYFFPFFLVHFPVLLLLRLFFYRDLDHFPWKKILMAWVSGLAGFIMIASAWVTIISVKDGSFKISSKAGAAHAVMGPKDIDRRHPFSVGGLFKPKENYAIHVFEDPSDVKFKTWSPFESKEYFIHQLKVIKENAVYILKHFITQSPFFTYAFMIGIIALIPISLFLNPMDPRGKYLYGWIIITFSIYCLGFLLLIARSPRRFYALMIVVILLSFHFMEKLANCFKEKVSNRSKKMLTVYLLIIICSAFALKPAVQFVKSLKHIVTVKQVNPYREIADQINAVEFPSPYAIIRSSQKPTTDYYITYFLKKQLLGRPLSTDVQGITEELKSAGGKSLLIFDNPEISEKFKLDGRYVHIASVKLNSNKRYDNAVNWIVSEHEILTGWDNEVNIFTLK